MSSVFIANVDDYIAPSQACINPIFADSVNSSNTSKEEKKIQQQLQRNNDNGNGNGDALVVSRSRRRRRPLKQSVAIPSSKDESSSLISKDLFSNNNNSNPKSNGSLGEVAKVSMADCLACSGCVTTAETVLVEQHSLKTLREKITQSKSTSSLVAFTISPASFADMLRHLGANTTTTIPEQQVMNTKRRLATFLQKTCRASIVLDGRIPLKWSLNDAASEFVHAYRQKKVSDHDTTTVVSTPSVAISALQQQVHRKSGTMETISNDIISSNGRWPLLTSSCPALVCLVEKSHESAVSHLSRTKSPMALAGAYLKHVQETETNDNILHIAIMPCHDKKLEASRKDLAWPSPENNTDSTSLIPDVDLVITTQEWLTLLQDAAGNKDDNDDEQQHLSKYLSSLDMANVQPQMPLLLCKSHDVILVSPDRQDCNTANDINNDLPSSFYSYSSGGYADFVFRYACRELFGFVISSQTPLPWTPIDVFSLQHRKRSRKIASRKRDYHSVSLYRYRDETELQHYSLFQQDDQKDCESVLTFAIAYGLQNMQRVLQPQQQTSLGLHAFDYVEAMACPSGCLNGGGQIRLHPRETPSETKRRVELSRNVLESSCRHRQEEETKNQDDASSTSSNVMMNNKLLMRTHFHIVPPMQYTKGATAGVSIQDTQW